LEFGWKTKGKKGVEFLGEEVLQEERLIKYIGFWDRVGMRLLDLLVTAIPFILMYKYLIILSVRANAIYPFVAYWIIFYAFYVFMTVRYGGTPGKLMLRARIVNKTGSYLTVGNSLYRLCFYIPYSLVIIMIVQIGLNEGVAEYDMVHYVNIHEGTLQVLKSLLSVAVLFDEFFLIFNKKKRAVHDLVAGSYVVSKESYLRGKEYI
jgi:uncharacterized RDD family membrane protein YckC